MRIMAVARLLTSSDAIRSLRWSARSAGAGGPHGRAFCGIHTKGPANWCHDVGMFLGITGIAPLAASVVRSPPLATVAAKRLLSTTEPPPDQRPDVSMKKLDI